MIVVDRHIGGEDGRLDIADTVAFQNLTVSGRLSRRQIGAARGESQTAHLIGTRPFFAEIIRRKIHAIRRRIASDALAHTVADLRASATEILGFGRIRRDSTLALVGGARIAVDRNIRVVIDARRAHCAIADDFFAITELLQYGTRQRVRALIGNFAFVVDAAAFFTFRLDDIHAIIGNDAFDARPRARADIRFADDAMSSFRNGHMLRHAGIASVDGARIRVVIGIAVIVEHIGVADYAKVNFAIACDLHRPGRGYAIEVRVDARARRGIAILFGTKLGVVAIEIRIARNLARIPHTNARFVTLDAG